MGFESPSHWVIIAVVVLVLFGYKKLPEMSRSVGRSLRIFKTEMKGMTDDESARDAADQPATSAPLEAQQPQAPVAPVTTEVPTAGVPPIPTQTPDAATAPAPAQPAPTADVVGEAPRQQAQS
jgi:sec-independent protein translocase protein TatA